MNLSFHPEAEAEFNEAIDYFERMELGLGYDFALELHAAVERAVDLPKAWSVLHGEVRRSLVKRFPFGVLYAEEQDEVFILAVMNVHRAPKYWKSRK